LRHPATRIVILCVALIAVRLLIEVGAHWLGIKRHSVGGLLIAAGLIAAMVCIYVIGIHRLEHRGVAELSGCGAARDLTVGFAIGVLLFGIVMSALLGLGVASVTTNEDLKAVPFALAAVIIAAVFEELLFRGVLFRIVEEGLGSWITLALTAGLFGAAHGLNRGATLLSDVAIALEAGVLLGAAYMYSRRLWLPIGLHTGWNFTEGGIFGASVSGGKAGGALASHFHGADILTGGQFGPEASLVAVALCFALGGGFLVLAYRRRRILPPRWHLDT
jgi:uncharacterized protein